MGRERGRELLTVVQLHDPDADLLVGRRRILPCEGEAGEPDER